MKEYGIVAVALGSGFTDALGQAEDALTGHGLSYCAVCDGPFYKGQAVAMIGGGNSALQEAIMLSDYCTKVTVVQNLDFLTGEARLVKVLESKPNVEVITGTVVSGIISEGGTFKGIKIKGADGEKELICDGMFIAIGLIPENAPFAELCELNDYGYFDTDESCETKTAGIFVAGDCRSKRIRQVTTASADGAVAALAACRYIDAH